ncbi:MAG: hypothetical protein RJA07_2636 [Bacteroidota bacterium]|jgi:hypothetical protein
MKKILCLFIISILANYHISTLSAQVPTTPGSYQWVKGFGSAFQMSGEDEKITSMKFDYEGNLIVCGKLVGFPHIQGLGGKKDSILTNRWQKPSVFQGFISKYDCNGNLLWFRELNDSINNTAIHDFVLDSMGNIYAFATCNIGGENIYFNDSLFAPWSFSPSIQGPQIMMKINKNGSMNWVWAQAYNASNYVVLYSENYLSYSNLTPNCLAIHNDTLSLLIAGGGLLGTMNLGNIPIYTGINILRYTLQGQLTDISLIDSVGYYTSAGFGIDKQGNYTAIANFGSSVNKFLDSTYSRSTASTFNPLSTIIKFNRNHVIRHIELGDSTFAKAIDFNATDNSFNILGGGGYGKPIYGGYATHLSAPGFGKILGTGVIKFNNLSDFNWGQCPDSTGGNRGFFSITSDPNQDVYGHLPFNDILKFQNLSLSIPHTQFRANIVKLSRNTGTLLSRLPDLNTTTVNSSTNLAAYQNLLINETGNLYITGNMTSNNVVAGLDTAYYYGGQNDMFIIKYGNNCGNTSSLITAAAPIEVLAKCNNNSIKLTWKDISNTEDKYYIYRSLTASSGFAKIDSVAANTTQYIDNAVSSGTNYWYAVSAHNNMGEGYQSNIDSSTLCGVGINEINTNNHLVVYPNPAYQSLVISQQSMINTVEVSNVLGQRLNIEIKGLKTNNCELNTENLPSGIYFIKTTDTKGDVLNGKFVKE